MVEDWIQGYRSCTREAASADLHMQSWWPLNYIVIKKKNVEFSAVSDVAGPEKQ